MKKFILPLLLILSISLLIAVESEASDVVGYFKILVPQSAWTPVSVPFEIVDGLPGTVFGDNWNSTPAYENPDFAMDIYNGRTTSYWFEYGWDFEPEFENDRYVLPGHAYYLYRDQPATDEYMYLTGKVNPQPISLVMKGLAAGGLTSFGINDAAPVSPEILGFTLTDPDYDNNIFDMIIGLDGSSGTYYGEYFGEYFGWLDNESEPFFLQPTVAYYYLSNQTGNWNWIYPSAPTRQTFGTNELRRSK